MTRASVSEKVKTRRQLFFISVLLLFGLVWFGSPAYGQSFKVGSFIKPAASGTQVVPHGLGETPKALILWTNGKTNESFGADFNFGFGVTDESLNRYSASIASDDNQTTTWAARSMYLQSIDIVTVGGTNYAQAYISSWDSTNFTLQWTIGNATQCVIHFIAIGGSGVSSKVVNWQMPDTYGNKQVTGVGFKPDLVIHVHAGYDFSTVPSRTDHASIGLGVMDAAGNQWATSVLSLGNAAVADTQRGQRTDACIHAFNNSLGVQNEASFVSMDPDGFTVDFGYAENSNFSQVFSLALKGVKAKAGVFSKTTGAGPISQSVAGVGFQPGAVLLASFQDIMQASPVANTRLGLGASDGTTQGTCALTDTDTLDPTQVDGIDKTSKVFVKVNNNTPSINAEADLATMDSNGFTLRWTTNDAVATEMLYLALGQASSRVADGPLIAYSQNASYVNNRLYYSLYQYGKWTSGAYAVTDPSGDYDQYYKVARTNPALTKQVVVSKDGIAGSRYLYASVWDGTNWDDGTGSPVGDVKNFGLTVDNNYRSFDAAFEQLSGDLLVVSATTSVNTINYWLWNGNTWSSTGTSTIPINNWTYRWSRLVPRPSSDEIAFIGSSDGGGVSAARWTGSAWTDTATCVTTGGTNASDAIDIQYVQTGANAGDIVAVWWQGRYLYRKIYRNDLGSWDASTQVLDLGVGNLGKWLKLKANSSSDDLILTYGATVGGLYSVYTIPYNGDTRAFGSPSSAHTTAAYVGASASFDNNRPFDVIWDPASGTNNVLLVYSDTSGLRYKTSSDGGTNWGSQQTISTSYKAYWVQLERMIDDTIHLAIHDDADDLNTWTWENSTWTFKNEITTDLETGAATNREVEAFALSGFLRKPDKFEYRRPITINLSQRGASCTGSLSNFPVLISLTGTWLKTTVNGGRIYNSNGYDIVFKAADGVTPLAHEIEYYDGSATGGTLVAWVRVPKLFENNQDTIIYIDYGSSLITSATESPSSVWDSNYVGVWHLKESGNATAGEYKDSTQYTNHGQGGEGTPGYVPTRVGGRIGYGQSFDGTDDYIDCGNDAELNITGTSRITVEAWVALQEIRGPTFYASIVGKGTQYYVYDDWNADYRAGFSINTPTPPWPGADPLSPLGTWYHVAFTYDGANTIAYRNGLVDATIPTTGNITEVVGSRVRFGFGDNYYYGFIDEVRISTVARNACWIETNYNNQNGPGSFTTVGDEIMLGRFENRKQITLNVSQRGSSCTGSLSNFPVLINLSGDWLKTKADGGSLYSANGYDIVFRDANNNQLDHEIEKYDGSATVGTLIAWVRIPTLFENNQDTVIYMYYGNAAITSPTTNPAGVWNTSYGWRGVWHLHKDLLDSTGNTNNTGISYGSEDIVGKFADAEHFTQSENDYVNFGNNSSLDLTSTGTLSAWVKFDTAPNTYAYVVGKSNGGNSDTTCYGISRDGGTGRFFLWVSDNVDQDLAFTSTNSWNLGTWYYFTGVWRGIGSTMQMYINGQPDGTPITQTNNAQIDSAQPAHIGCGFSSTCYDQSALNGTVDEVRISSVARDTCWIQTEYNNYNSPSAFSTVGTGEEFEYKYRKQVTILDSMTPTANCSSDLSNFPVLINLSGDWLKTVANGGNISHPYGYDIIFKAQDGETKLDHEIEYYKGSGGGSFPQVASVTPSTFVTDAQDHNVAMPATVAAGDLLLVLFTNDGSATVTTPAGWTLIQTATRAANARGSVYAKVAAGNEGGTTVNFVTSSALEQAAAQVYRILAAYWYGDIAGGIASASFDPGGTTPTPNPPSLNPGAWDVENTLWIAYAAGSSWTSVTSYPTNYTNGTHTISSTGATGASASSARLESMVASEDPGTFTMTSTSDGVVFTIAIRPSTGRLVAWVRIPTLKFNANTIIYMYYGNPGITAPTANPTGVWDSNYAAVWHLKEKTGGTGAIKDSTSYVNHGTDSGGPTLGATGKIGDAIEFDGSNDVIRIDNSKASGHVLDFTAGPFTISAWFNTQVANTHIAGKRDGTLDQYQFGVGNFPTLFFRAGDEEGWQTPPPNLSYNTWYYGAVVVNASGWPELYLDGTQQPWTDAVGDNRPHAFTHRDVDFSIGARWNTDPGTAAHFDGLIDEVRVSNTARSSCWIQTEYNNQYSSSPGTYYTVEGEEELTFNHRKQITILNSMTPASCSSNLTNFPVHISLSGNWLKTTGNGGNIYSANGYDIIFRAQDGVTKLDHEIEDYNGSLGTLVAWVRIPTLLYNANTIIYMYYGNSTITTSQANPAGVWNSSNYRGVWHLNNAFTDSTSYANHGTNFGSTDAAGKIGRGRGFDGNDYIGITGLLGSPATATLSAWVNLTAGDTAGSEVISMGDNVSIRLDNIPSTPDGTMGIYRYGSSSWYETNTATLLAGTGWHHVTYVANPSGNSQKVYIDGIERASNSYSSSILYTAGNTTIGKHPSDTSYDFNGIIDEVRVSSIVRDACWIGTEYTNQNSPLASYAVEGEEFDYKYRKQITIRDSMTPTANCSSDLTNFPVLISLANQPWLETVANGGDISSQYGYDIIFKAEDGETKLDHEIERYDGSDGVGSLVAWVRIPTLRYNANTIIYMYYGNPAITSPTANPAAVWDSNYRGVWHLKEDPSGTAPQMKDSKNTNHGTSYGSMTSGDQVAAKINGGLDLEGTDDYINAANNGSTLNVGQAFTVEAWVKRDTTGTRALVTKAYSDQYSFKLSLDGATNIVRLDVNTGAGYVNVQGDTISDSNWHYVGAYSNGTNIKVFKDGVVHANSNSTPASIPYDTNNLWIGTGRWGSNPVDYLDGMIDEVRVSNVARSACWIGTSYNNQESPLTHIDVEGAENLDYNYRQLITISDSMTPASCTSDLTNFPILVSLSGNWLKTVGNGGNIQHPLGYDIIFRDENGLAKLDHEIEQYNGTAGTLLAWVRIPTLHFNDITNIYIYYGNSAITSPTANASGVWNTSYGWRGVWHLKESVTNDVTTVGAHDDSTSNNNDGTQVNNDDLSAKIYNGQDFEGDLRDEYVNIPNSASLENVQEGDYTVEAWFYADILPPGTEPAWNAYYGIVGKEGWNLGLEMNNIGQFTMHHWLAAGPTNELATSGAKNATIWYHVAGVVSRTDGYTKIYVNGVNEATNNFTAGSAALEYGTAPWRIGIWGLGRGNYDGPANGKIDEVRISNIARDACWIGTEYNNQNSPTTYVTLGSEQGFAPTAVKLTSFKATRYPEGTLLEWKTGHEVDNLGFHVYREENGQLVRLTPEPVAGSALLAGKGTSLTAGRHYHWWDLSSLSAMSYQPSAIRYWLKDIDLNGKQTMHGPVSPTISREPLPNKFRPELLSEIGFKLNERYHHYWKVQELREKLTQKAKAKVKVEAKGKASNLKAHRAGAQSLVLSPHHSRISPQSSSLDTTIQQSLAGRPAVKILVRDEGLYRVTRPELVAAGLSSRVDPRRLQLFTEGREQSIHVIGGKDGRFGPRDAIEFYGTGLDTPSTDTRVYWLIEGHKSGKRVESSHGQGGRIVSSSFLHTIEKKERTLYFAALRNGEEENFFGPVVYMNRVEQILSLQHLDRAIPQDALLEVELQGATEGPHRVKVYLNDENEEVGEIIFEGQKKGSLRVEIPQSMLEEGENLVSLAAMGDDMDASLLDTIRLTYWHTPTADDNSLRLTARGGSHLTVDGFSSSNIRVFDITDLDRVLEVVGKVELQKGSYGVSFRVPGHGERTVLALTEDRVKNPSEIISDHPSSWHQEKGGYDLLIISHRDFLKNLQTLIKLRVSQGYKVALIDVEDLYDEFTFGHKSPKAIRDFLKHAKTQWHKPPRFALLVGDASFDPRNYLGLGDMDYVPTKLIDTVYMETASDDWFVDLNNDGLPEMAVGRLPVQTKEEAAVVVSKIIGYEKSSKKREALLVADANDGFDFEEASEEVKGLLPSSLMVRKIYRGEFSSDAQAKTELVNGINQGVLLVNFIGHGSVESWRGSLLTLEDADNLINGVRLPFFVNMTCLNGFFQNPYGETLAEALMKAQGGGAIAIWTSSGLTEPDKQALMNKELVKLLFNNRESLTLGEATAKAKASVSDQDVKKTWILFGDPSQRLSR